MKKLNKQLLPACSALALCGAAGLFATPVYAQEALQTETVEAQAATDEQAVKKKVRAIDEEIVVTGSRIRRDEFTSTAPIQVITTNKSALAGLISATDILQGSSLASGQQVNDTFSGFVTDGGPGAKQISLRGLGGQRSLVLVNGKRWGPSGVRGQVASVDLSALPNGLISRYEILKDGASSVYGADAVAGVVNAITRTSAEGGEIQLDYVQPELGEGERFNIEGLWGVTGDNYNITVAASAFKQNSITQSDIDYGACNKRPRLTDQDGDGTIDNRDPVTGEELCFGFIYGFAVSPFGWVRYEPSLANPDPSNPNYDPRVNGVFGVPYYTSVPENGLDNSGAFYRDVRAPGIAHVRTEEDIFNLSSLGSYDFNIGERGATAYYEAYFNRRETASNRGYAQFFPTVPSTNPTNPFGTSNAAIMAAAGRGFNATPVLPNYGIIDPVTKVEIDRFNVFAGLKGDISETWTYEAYVGYGYSEGSYRRQAFLSKEVAASLDAVYNDQGQLVCRDLANNPGCVAANLFTEDAMLNGILPADYINYVTAYTEGETTYDSVQFSGFATGELFDLPAGAVEAVIGAETRRESIDDLPDEQDRAGNIFNATAAGRTEGTDTVKEIFGELFVPVLEDSPYADELNLELSGRWTDYDSYGDDTTYRAAINWQVNDWLRLRGTQGTSFRAPTLYEQFLGDETGFANGQVDPCLNYTSVYEPGDTVYDNCAAVVPANFGENGSKGILTRTGGSDTLKAETSESYTYGFIIQPAELGLSVAVNWFDIRIENTVSSLSATGLLGACYSSVNFSSPFCSRIGARDQDGFISEIDSSFINVGVAESSGYDVDFAFEKAFNSWDLLIDGTITYIDEYNTEILGSVSNYEDHFAFPHWRGDMDIQANYKEWLVNWRIDYFGTTDEGPVYDPGTTNVDRVSSTKYQMYHTLAVSWEDDEHWEAVFTIRNIFDRDPPLVADGTGTVTANRFLNTLPGAGYPLYGRTFSLQARYKF